MSNWTCSVSAEIMDLDVRTEVLDLAIISLPMVIETIMIVKLTKEKMYP